MAICRQACPYNTLDGCKVKECGGFCQLTNTAQPITEYRMTNADRIRAMSDENLHELLHEIYFIMQAQKMPLHMNGDNGLSILNGHWQPAEDIDDGT